jgi:hypothetical protein
MRVRFFIFFLFYLVLSIIITNCNLVYNSPLEKNLYLLRSNVFYSQTVDLLQREDQTRLDKIHLNPECIVHLVGIYLPIRSCIQLIVHELASHHINFSLDIHPRLERAWFCIRR